MDLNQENNFIEKYSKTEEEKMLEEQERKLK